MRVNIVNAKGLGGRKVRVPWEFAGKAIVDSAECGIDRDDGATKLHRYRRVGSANGRKQTPILGATPKYQILALTHDRGQWSCTLGKAGGHLSEGIRRARLQCPLRDFKAFLAQGVVGVSCAVQGTSMRPQAS